MSEKDLPFIEVDNIRIFSKDVDPNYLQWHWDEQNRIVSCSHETDWMIQFDNVLPEKIIKGAEYKIIAGSWHRLIKGSESLTLKIIKL